MKTTNRYITQRKLAVKLNIGADFLNHILHDRCPCPPSLAPKLEEETGIDRTVWVWGSRSDKLSAWNRFKKHDVSS